MIWKDSAIQLIKGSADDPGYAASIVAAAQAIGVSAYAIAGAIAEENHAFGIDDSVFDRLVKTKTNERVMGPPGAPPETLPYRLSQSDFEQQYQELQNYDREKYYEEQSWWEKYPLLPHLATALEKDANLLLNDIGPANIKILTAIRLLKDYIDDYKDKGDPLNLKQYENDYRGLINALLDGQNNAATAAFAALMIKEADDFYSYSWGYSKIMNQATGKYEHVIDYNVKTPSLAWALYTEDEKDAIRITYFNLGQTRCEINYAKAMEEFQGDRNATITLADGSTYKLPQYMPRPGGGTAGGEEYLEKENIDRIKDALPPTAANQNSKVYAFNSNYLSVLAATLIGRNLGLIENLNDLRQLLAADEQIYAALRDVLSGAVGVEKIITDQNMKDVKSLILGDDAFNKLQGTSGNDLLLGFDGQDSVYGGVGNDFLHGGSGHDRLYGGTGNDTYYFNVADTSDVAPDLIRDDQDGEGKIVFYVPGAGGTSIPKTLTGGSRAPGDPENTFKDAPGLNIWYRFQPSTDEKDCKTGSLFIYYNDTLVTVIKDFQKQDNGYLGLTLTDPPAGPEKSIISTFDAEKGRYIKFGNQLNANIKTDLAAGDKADGSGPADVVVGGAGSEEIVLATAIGYHSTMMM